MPKYRAYGVVSGSKYLGIVEAPDKDEAELKALESEEAFVSLCHQCSSECEDAEVTEVNLILVEDGEEVEEEDVD